MHILYYSGFLDEFGLDPIGDTQFNGSQDNGPLSGDHWESELMGAKTTSGNVSVCVSVSVSVYVSLSVSVPVYVSLSVSVSVYVSLSVSVSVCLYVCLSLCLCMCLCMSVCLSVYLSVYTSSVWVCTCTHTYICMYIIACTMCMYLLCDIIQYRISLYHNINDMTINVQIVGIISEYRQCFFCMSIIYYVHII